LKETFMLNWIMQLQLLLTALSAFLPFAPEKHRARITDILEVAGKALAAGGSVAANLDDLAAKLAAIRAEVEAMAAAGRAVTADELDAAMARVRTASAAFRAALQAAEA
jgi:hypothetical protein